MDSNSDDRSRALTRNELVAFEKLKLKWKELPVEDIILDGLYLNCIRLVKEYFEKNLKIDLKQNKINDIGLKSVLQLLADKDLRGAEILLSHMNFDSNQKIYQICFFTPYKQLRDYLLSVLTDRKKLNDTEMDMLNYLKNLEAVYPCRSFSQTSQSSLPFKNLNYKLVESNVEANKNDYFICKELVRSNEKRESVVAANLNTRKYGHVIIEWLRDWPANVKKRIILDSVLSIRDKNDYSIIKSDAFKNLLDEKELFYLLMEQNNLDLLTEWINFSFLPPKSDPVEGDAATSSKPSETSLTLFSIRMNQAMIDEMSSNKYLVANYSNEILLNNLARLNVFCSKESADFYQLLKRLSVSMALFDRSLFAKRDDEFHLKLATNLITKRKYPFDFFWSYLDFYNASNPNKNSQGLLNDAQQPELYSSKCLKMMQAFRQIFSNMDSANYFSNVCMKNVEFYFNQVENMQMSNLFDVKYKEHHLVALAMSLYCDIPLSVNESIKFEHLIDEYPSLRLLVDNKQSKQPISLYALLQEHSRLDLTKIFNWQSSNTIALFKQDDKSNKPGQPGKLGSSSSSSLLSFENTEFSKRFAYKDSLDFAFFLRQGRPFFAYHHFLSSQLKKYGKINKTLMEHARLRSQLIMIENFQDTKIVSSCIIFGELMNADSFRLKLNVYLMNILNDYYIKRGMDVSLANKKCKYLFTEFFKGDVEAKRLVDIFEHVLITVMIENYDQKQMFTMEACSIWLPLMCFCKINNLPYSCKYLHLCAESNQWLMYLIFAQMYQIPRYQVISGLEYFSDTGIKQHLEYALHNVITSQYQSSDSAGSSLSLSASANKMNKSVKKENRITSFISAFKKKSIKKPSVNSTARSTKGSKDKKNDSSENEQSSEYETELESSLKAQTDQLKDCLDSIDFYELLINCQNAADPVLQLQLESLRWHTPVLAVFATFYQNHDKISCLTTFLNASMKQQFTYSMHQQQQKNMRKSISIDKQSSISSKSPTVGQAKSVLFGLNDLKDAIQMAASKSYLRTLLNSLKIFIPKTILDIYVEFLYNIFVNKDASQAQKLYSSYKYELIKVTLNKHQSYIPLEWYEEIMNKLTRITILKCHNIDDLNNLTSILGEINEYRRLVKLVYTMKSNKVNVNCEECLDMDDKSDQFTEICFKVIEELLKVHKFNEAEDLADFCELTKDRIHLARIGYQIEKLRLNNDFEEILVFWKSAHIQLMKIGIKDSDFIDFLKFQNTRSNMFLERIVLLNLISQLCPNDSEISKNLRLILLEFVNNYKKRNELSNLKEIFKKVLLPGTLSTDPLKDFLEIIKDSRPIDFSEKTRHNLNEQDKDALNILLNNLVDIGKLSQAYTVAKDFGYFNKDLKIILNMLYVCLDMIKPDELDYCMQSFDSASFKGIKLTNVLRSLSRTTESETIKDRIECLEKLACLSHYGNKYCYRIKLDFRLAHEILKTNYVKILNENEWSLLKTILYSASSSSKYEIAKEFSKAYELNQLKLTDFLLEEVLNTLNAYVNSNKIGSSSGQAAKQLMFNPMSSDEFSRLIKIFDKNSNLFGAKLLDKSRQLLADAKNTDDYTILTELLIRSHDCFIQSCSMEGISNVLQASKMCASKLEKAGEFNIMIRLLTGIAHFSEMTYIMDFLWNNHQFEMLFGKGIGKDDKLRLALLDYLKRYHPNDHETYTMVTLNFTMHREIASMLEEAAYQQLKLLENKTIENTPEILTDLQSILQYFSDAAQSFMKEDCVKQAENCIKKARLIALQIHFLSSNLIIINLNSATVTRFIVSHPKFWEAYIVSEAYEKKSDWPQALFNQFILNGNEKYLLDFKSHIQLTANIFDEVASRFKLSEEPSKLNPAAIENMKKFLKYCKDVGQYYKLASVLDFKDVLVELQSKNYSSIVNDLIANKKLVIQL